MTVEYKQLHANTGTVMPFFLSVQMQFRETLASENLEDDY